MKSDLLDSAPIRHWVGLEIRKNDTGGIWKVVQTAHMDVWLKKPGARWHSVMHWRSVRFQFRTVAPDAAE